jgi:ABC-type lipoprotein export system ATPase subunit
MAIIAGWIAPTHGGVIRQGIETTSWVFQNPFGVPRRSAIDHVSYPFIARGETAAEADAHAFDLMRAFDLTKVAERPFRHLSGGEAQRLMLARATAVSPDLLLVDEPTAQLDRSTAHLVNRVLSNVVTDKTIVIVATHDAETREACDEHVNLTAFADVEGDGSHARVGASS